MRGRSKTWLLAGAIAVALTGAAPDLAAAVSRHEIHRSEELKFESAVETVIYHSEGAAYGDHEKAVEALEARPRELKVAGRALLGEWRIYRRYDRGHLFRIRAPTFWRHDWRQWKSWQRRTLDGVHRGAQLLRASDWAGFKRAKAEVVRAEHKRGTYGRRMHLDLGG